MELIWGKRKVSANLALKKMGNEMENKRVS
jgi:hypothetical protein